jgi:hypothetical protein
LEHVVWDCLLCREAPAGVLRPASADLGIFAGRVVEFVRLNGIVTEGAILTELVTWKPNEAIQSTDAAIWFRASGHSLLSLLLAFVVVLFF